MIASHDVYAHAKPGCVRALREGVCWNGTLGRTLVRDANAVVDGIERDAVQAQHARDKGCRHVDVADLDLAVPPADGRTCDFLLFGDVLEHLVYRDQLLDGLTPRLKPGGRAILSLPDVANAATRLTHLLGSWGYKDYGILGHTHPRFFTLHKCPRLIREPLRWLGRAWPSLFAIQIVLEAVPAVISAPHKD